MDLFLSESDFTAWLRSLPGDLTFEVCSTCGCPLARWLHCTLPTEVTSIRVYDESLCYTVSDADEHEQTLPAWAMAFVDVFDTHFQGHETVTCRSVRRAFFDAPTVHTERT